MPIHWNDQFASNARVDSLVAAITDSVSGQPEFKYSRAAIKKVEVPCWATLVSRSKIDCSQFTHWSVAPLVGDLGYIYQLALESEFNWQTFIASISADLSSEPLAYAQFSDGANLDQRLICYTDNRMELAVFSHRDNRHCHPKPGCSGCSTTAPATPTGPCYPARMPAGNRIAVLSAPA